MAEVAGKTNYVKILTGTTAMVGAGAPTGAKINGVDNSTFNKLCDLLDITQFGDTHRDRMAGIKDTSVTVSGNLDTGDTTGQLELEPGDTVYIAVHPSGATVAGTQVKCIVESFEQSADATGKQTFSATLQGIAAPEASPAHS